MFVFFLEDAINSIAAALSFIHEAAIKRIKSPIKFCFRNFVVRVDIY